VSRGGVVATGWAVRGSNVGGGRDFLHPSKPALGPTQSPIQWVSAYPWVKGPRRGVNHPTPSGGEVKERLQLYLYSPSVPVWQVIGWIFRNLHSVESDCYDFIVSFFAWDTSGVYFVSTPCYFALRKIWIMKYFSFTFGLYPLKTKRRLFYLKTQSVPRSKHFSSRL
jgi:hypothetical protein